MCVHVCAYSYSVHMYYILCVHVRALYIIKHILYTIHSLQYIVAPTELNSQTLWLSVWDWDRFGRNQFLGEVRLPLASLDLTDPTEHWHTLQDKVIYCSLFTVNYTHIILCIHA